MTSPRRLVALGGFGLLVALLGVVLMVRSPQRSFRSFPAPTFTLPGLRDGEGPVDLSAYRGRPVVLNFFFSSCKPCVDEMPRFEAESQRRGDAVVFLGIDHFEPLADGRRIVSRTKITYPVGWDETGVVAPTFGALAFPTTVLIDRQGIVRKRFVAAVSADELRRAIDTIERAA